MVISERKLHPLVTIVVALSRGPGSDSGRGGKIHLILLLICGG